MSVVMLLSDSPRMNTGIEADLSCSVLFHAGWGNLCLCATLYRRSGGSLCKCTDYDCKLNIYHMYKIKHRLHVDRCDHTTSLPAALQESKKRKGVAFPLTSVPANHTAGDLNSRPFPANQRWWWAHASFIPKLWFAAAVWHRGAACALHMGACVVQTHTEKESGSLLCLEAVDRNIFAVLVLWHLPSSCSIINNSQAQQCVPVSECMSVCERTHACVMVCVVMMCSHQVFGEPTFPHSSLRICFSSLCVP